MMDQQYINTMDVFPLETADQNKLHRFYEYLREGRLTTTRCSRCGELSWPPRTVCPICISDELEWVDLPTRGKLYSFTMQVAGISPVFESPLFLGTVEFDNGMRILSKLVEATEDDLEIGREVEMTVIELPGPVTPRMPNPPSRVLHAFRPVKSGA